MTGSAIGGAFVALAIAVPVALVVFAGTRRLLSPGDLDVSGAPVRLRAYALSFLAAYAFLLAALALALSDRMTRGAFFDYVRWWLAVTLPFFVALALRAGLRVTRNSPGEVQSRRAWRGLLGTLIALLLIAQAATAIVALPTPWAAGFKTYSAGLYFFTFGYPETWREAPDDGVRGHIAFFETPSPSPIDASLDVWVYEQPGERAGECLSRARLLLESDSNADYGLTYPLEVNGTDDAAIVGFSTSRPEELSGRIVAATRPGPDGAPNGCVVMTMAAAREDFAEVRGVFEHVIRSLRIGDYYP